MSCLGYYFISFYRLLFPSSTDRVLAMWGVARRAWLGLRYSRAVTTKGKHGKQCKPALKTAVHASFLLLMTLPRLPTGSSRFLYNSYFFPKYKRCLCLIVGRFGFPVSFLHCLVCSLSLSLSHVFQCSHGDGWGCLDRIADIELQ